MANPTVPQYVSLKDWRTQTWDPGNALPDIQSTGTLITNQATLDSVIARAATQTPTIGLVFSTTPLR